MGRSSLSTSLTIRPSDRVVSRLLERQHGHPTLTRKQLVAARLDGEAVVRQIRMRVVMEKLPRGILPPEHRIHLLVTVARHLLGTHRRAHPTHTRMVVKHRPGIPLPGHPTRIRIVAALLRGMPLRGLPIHTLTVNPRLGVMMEAEHLVGVEDGRVGRIIIINGGTHRLHDPPTQATLRS